MDKHAMASEIVATYTLQYMVDRGTHPSRETVLKWIEKLAALDEAELIRVGGDLAEQKRLLR